MLGFERRGTDCALHNVFCLLYWELLLGYRSPLTYKIVGVGRALQSLAGLVVCSRGREINCISQKDIVVVGDLLIR